MRFSTLFFLYVYLCFLYWAWNIVSSWSIRILRVKYDRKGFNQKRKENSPGSATITNRSPFQTPRGRGNRQIQTSTNRSNIPKALRLAPSFPSEVIAMLKGLKKHKNKMAQGKTSYNKSPRRINHKAPKSKTNTGTTALEPNHFKLLF